MTTTVGNTSSTVPAPKATTMAGAFAGDQKEMFLKLLVAQLKNQDPTSPMDQKDMMGQMAQMTSVEQLVNMAKSLETMQTNATFAQSVGLIGKTIDHTDADGNITRDATVSQVSAVGGIINLVLSDGSKVSPANVVAVR